MSIQSVLGLKQTGNGHIADMKGEAPEYQPSDRTSFAKHLRWKLKTRSVEWMLITPQMASEMLSLNSIEGFENRPLSRATAEKYGRLMKAGKWGHKGQGTCEPIIFSDLGRILSAQHRLFGAELLDVSFRALVVFGEPDENFAFIDQGRRRTAAHVFAINGVPNYVMAAAATRLVVGYEAGKISGDHLNHLETSNQETYEAYLRFPDLQESVKRVGLKFNADRLPCPSVAAAVHYLCARKSRRAADEYFDKVASGVGFSSQREPAKKVRDFLTRENAGRITAKMTAAALIHGWNMTRTNRLLTRVDSQTIQAIV